MAELYGTIVFEAANPSLFDCLTQFSEETPAETVLALLEAAGITPSDDDFSLLFDVDEGVLFAENISHREGYVAIEPFGEEWIEVLQVLSRSSSLSFWGRLQHEYGIEYYVAIAGGKGMITAVDEEDGELDDDEVEKIENKWRAAIPNTVRHYFPDDYRW